MEKKFTVDTWEQHGFDLTDGNDDWDGDWTNDDWDEIGLGVEKGVITLFTLRGGGSAPVTVVVQDEHKLEDLDSWSGVWECGIEIGTGQLKFNPQWADDQGEMDIDSGIYKVIIYAGNLESVEYDGDSGDEYYKIVLTPSEYVDPKVLKKFTVTD